MNLLTPYVDKMVSNFLEQSPDSPQVAHTAPLAAGRSEKKKWGGGGVKGGWGGGVESRIVPMGVLFGLFW